VDNLLLSLATDESYLRLKRKLEGARIANAFADALMSSEAWNNPTGVTLRTLNAPITIPGQPSSSQSTRVTSELDDDKEHVPTSQLLTVEGGREHESGEDVRQDTLVNVIEDEDSDRKGKSVEGNKLPSELQDNQDGEKEIDQVPEKENTPPQLMPDIPDVPRFQDGGHPDIRRDSGSSFKMVVTPEPLEENEPKCMSEEVNKTASDWVLIDEQPSDENIHQSVEVRSPFAERDSNRNSLEAFQDSVPTTTADTSQEIVRKDENNESDGKLIEESRPKETTLQEAASDPSPSKDRSRSEVEDTSSKPSGKLISRQLTLFDSDDEEADETNAECSAEVIAEKADDDGTIRDSSTTISQPPPSSFDSNERDKPTDDKTTSPEKNSPLKNPIGRLLRREKTSRHLEGPSLESEDEDAFHPEDFDDNEYDDDNWLMPFTKKFGTYRPSYSRPEVEASSSKEVTADKSAPEGRNSSTSTKRMLEDQDENEVEQSRSVVPKTASITFTSQGRSRIPLAERLDDQNKRRQT
jgi:hypothetical protein